MPLYMEVDKIDGGITMDVVAAAHQADLQIQGVCDVNFRRYWVDEQNGRIFCLVEAPNALVPAAVHRVAHGLMADEIYQVQEGC